MEKNIVKIAIRIICIILATFFLFQIKSYAQTDITSTFKDENLKNAILELAKEATDDENKTQKIIGLVVWAINGILCIVSIVYMVLLCHTLFLHRLYLKFYR